MRHTDMTPGMISKRDRDKNIPNSCFLLFYLQIFVLVSKHTQGVYIFRQESELYNYELADESLDDSYDSC